MIVLRDMMFGNHRTFGDLHGKSLEGMATNILAARLKHLEAEGLVTAVPDPAHKQKKIYRLTEKGISLVPVMAQLGAWGLAHAPFAPELGVRAKVLAEGGPEAWADFMAELRHLHLGTPTPEGARSVLGLMRGTPFKPRSHDRQGEANRDEG